MKGHWGRRGVLCLVLAFCCTACNGAAAPAEPPAAAVPTSSAPQTTYTAPPLAENVFDEAAATGADGVLIDTSHTADGYVGARATGGGRYKFQTVFGETKYNYDLPADGSTQYYVLQSGSGSYTLRVLRNITDNKYAEVCSAKADVALADEFRPFLHASQMVRYTADSACTAKAAALAAAAPDAAGAVSAIYAYIRDNIDYDTEKAKTVQNGYLPDPDETLATGRGICFDYAALAAAMLRSQGIPAKLITGYVSPDNIYHAWNMIWLDETGWITVSIEAPADTWSRIDLTFAAGAGADFAGDGTGYTERYTY